MRTSKMEHGKLNMAAQTYPFVRLNQNSGQGEVATGRWQISGGSGISEVC